MATPSQKKREQEGYEALLGSFAQADAMEDGGSKVYFLYQAAKTHDIPPDQFLALYQEYLRERNLPKWKWWKKLTLFSILNARIGTLVNWMQGITLFSFLAYLSNLAILIGILSYVTDGPERKRAAQQRYWSTIETVKDRKYSRERKIALEALNGDCLNLEGLNLKNAHLEGLELNGCQTTFPEKGWFPLFVARGAELRGVQLQNSNLNRANLSLANMTHANLKGAQLVKVDLSGADLSYADLSGANLRQANLRDTNLYKAKLDDANLTAANLTGANLEKATLNRASLKETDLSDALLMHAHLKNALLPAATLHGADFFKADLGGAVLNRTCMDSQTILFQANLKDAQLAHAFVHSYDILFCANFGEEGGLGSTRTITPEQIAALEAFPLTLGTCRKTAPKRLGLILYADGQGVFQDFNADILEGFENNISDNHLTVRGIQEDLEIPALIAQLTEEGVDAIVTVPPHDLTEVEKASQKGVVVVGYDRHFPKQAARDWGVPSVQNSQFELGWLSGWYLVQRLVQAGRTEDLKQIGVFTSGAHNYNRIKGFRTALAESGLPYEETATFVYGEVETEEDRKRLAREFLNTYGDQLKVLWTHTETPTANLVEAVWERQKTLKGVWVSGIGSDHNQHLLDMLSDSGGYGDVLQVIATVDAESMGKKAAEITIHRLQQGFSASRALNIPATIHARDQDLAQKAVEAFRARMDP